MSMFQDIKINGVTVPTPLSYKLEFSRIYVDAERTKDYTFKGEPLTNKRVVTLTYDIISNADLLVILGETWYNFVSSKEYKLDAQIFTPNGVETIKVYIESTSTMEMTRSSNIIDSWVGFSIKLVEI